MKCLIVVAFVALTAVAFAQEPVAATPTQNEKAIEPVKTENEKDVRDKRGVLLTSYATAPVAYAPYPAPVAYSSYPVAGLPYVYSAAVRQYPSYVASPLTYIL